MYIGTLQYIVSYNMTCYNSLFNSIIYPVAMVIAPAIIPGEADIFRFIINVSFTSRLLSFITVMFIVLLLVPAVIMAVCVVESKSMLSPMAKF